MSFQRRRIDLLDKLRTGKGLSKKRKNIIGGNFNVVENDRYGDNETDGDKDDSDDVEEEKEEEKSKRGRTAFPGNFYIVKLSLFSGIRYVQKI